MPYIEFEAPGLPPLRVEDIRVPISAEVMTALDQGWAFGRNLDEVRWHSRLSHALARRDAAQLAQSDVTIHAWVRDDPIHRPADYVASGEWLYIGTLGTSTNV